MRRQVSKTYDCPVCGPVDSVEFEETAESGKFERESVVDYGECKVAAAAVNPKNPSSSDLATCPIFRSQRKGSNADIRAR